MLFLHVSLSIPNIIVFVRRSAVGDADRHDDTKDDVESKAEQKEEIRHGAVTLHGAVQGTVPENEKDDRTEDAERNRDAKVGATIWRETQNQKNQVKSGINR